MRICRMTVYRVLGRWLAEGEEGLEDKPRGRPKGSGKTTFATMNEIRKLQENPELGAFRIHAALEQKRGVEVGPRTVGRIMAVHRELYGLGKCKRSPHQKKEMPFEATRRHQFWSADIRYLKTALPEQVYCISILENYSRKILASEVGYYQDLTAFLPVLYSAVESYGAPEALVTDGGAVFRANPALSIYESLSIDKVEIAPGQPWQSLIETTFNIQHLMMDHYFKRAETFEEVLEAHARWMEDYNAQRHSAHGDRTDGRHSPDAVLSFYTRARYQPANLQRIFYEARFERILDAVGYMRFMHWRLLANEALCGRYVTLWLSSDALTVEYAGKALSRFEVEYCPGRGGAIGKLKEVRSPELFETTHLLPQPRLFGLDEILGEGWMKALRLKEYASRRAEWPTSMQPALFSLAADC
jgi:putative transposase